VPNSVSAYAINMSSYLSVAIIISLVTYVCGDVTALYATQSGKGTYYGDDGGKGNCGIYPVPSDIASAISFTVAINSADYFNSASCGACILISGNGNGAGGNPIKGNFTAMVNDQCPSCAAGGLDLAKSGDGAWDITWKIVDCPVGQTKIQYSFQSANLYYIKLQARNYRVPLNYINIKNTNTNTFVQMTRTSDNYFTLPSGFPTPLTYPLSIQLVSFSGETISDTIPNSNGNGNPPINTVFSGGSQAQFSTNTLVPNDVQSLSISVGVTMLSLLALIL